MQYIPCRRVRGKIPYMFLYECPMNWKNVKIKEGMPVSSPPPFPHGRFLTPVGYQLIGFFFSLAKQSQLFRNSLDFWGATSGLVSLVTLRKVSEILGTPITRGLGLRILPITTIRTAPCPLSAFYEADFILLTLKFDLARVIMGWAVCLTTSRPPSNDGGAVELSFCDVTLFSCGCVHAMFQSQPITCKQGDAVYQVSVPHTDNV